VLVERCFTYDSIIGAIVEKMECLAVVAVNIINPSHFLAEQGDTLARTRKRRRRLA